MKNWSEIKSVLIEAGHLLKKVGVDISPFPCPLHCYELCSGLFKGFLRIPCKSSYFSDSLGYPPLLSSAVLISSIQPKSLLSPSIHAHLYINPWAQYPYRGVLTQLDTYQVDGHGLLQLTDGRNIFDILDISNETNRV